MTNNNAAISQRLFFCTSHLADASIANGDGYKVGSNTEALLTLFQFNPGFIIVLPSVQCINLRVTVCAQP